MSDARETIPQVVGGRPMSDARETIPQVVDAMRRTADQLDALAAMMTAANRDGTAAATEMLRGFADRVEASMVNADRFPDAAREAYHAYEAYWVELPSDQRKGFSNSFEEWMCRRAKNGGAE